MSSNGEKRHSHQPLRRIGIDEKSVKKRHVYFTVVSNLVTRTIIWVDGSRKRETLNAFWAGLSMEGREGIEGTAMGIHEPYIRSTIDKVPDDASKIIVFDKFHVTMHLSRANDLTRRMVVREGGPAGRLIMFVRCRRTASAAIRMTSEGINSRTQLITFRARGFRNQTRFERAIMFHIGGLDT